MDKTNLIERELQVLEHVAKGFTNKEIAQKIYVSEETIKDRIKSIKKKLELPIYTTRVQLVNTAYAKGLVSCPCQHVPN